jgi:hypothetical protein
MRQYYPSGVSNVDLLSQAAAGCRFIMLLIGAASDAIYNQIRYV